MSATIVTNSRQRGATLIVGLIMVLLITIIGLAAIRGSGLQEQMAGNMRDRHIAFDAAEAALREGESALTGGPASVPMNDLGFMETNERPAVSYWTTPADEGGFDWENNAATYSEDIKNTHERPRYVVERVEFLEPGQFGSGNDFQSVKESEPVVMFRVTGRAEGGSENTVVILQSTFR